MKVRECMCNKVFCIKPDTTITETAKVMLNKHVGCVPVCDDNQNIVGIVTDRDLTLRSLACDKDMRNTPVSEIMTTNLHDVTPESDVSEASKIMCNCQVKRLPVVDNNVLVGIITLGDLANQNEIENELLSNTTKGICRCHQNSQNNQ